MGNDGDASPGQPDLIVNFDEPVQVPVLADLGRIVDTAVHGDVDARRQGLHGGQRESDIEDGVIVPEAGWKQGRGKPAASSRRTRGEFEADPKRARGGHEAGSKRARGELEADLNRAPSGLEAGWGRA